MGSAESEVRLIGLVRPRPRAGSAAQGQGDAMFVALFRGASLIERRAGERGGSPPMKISPSVKRKERERERERKKENILGNHPAHLRARCSRAFARTLARDEFLYARAGIRRDRVSLDNVTRGGARCFARFISFLPIFFPR